MNNIFVLSAHIHAICIAMMINFPTAFFDFVFFILIYLAAKTIVVLCVEPRGYFVLFSICMGSSLITFLSFDFIVKKVKIKSCIKEEKIEKSGTRSDSH